MRYRDVCHAKDITSKAFWNTFGNIFIQNWEICSSLDEDERNRHDVITFLLYCTASY
jgi:hypothetical protein